MPTAYHLTVHFDNQGTWGAGDVVNSFTVLDSTGTDDADVDDICAAIRGFYNSYQGGGTLQVSDFLAPNLSRLANESKIKAYAIPFNLDGSPHGSPVYEESFTLGPSASATAIPPQVASVLTLRGRGALIAPVEVPGVPKPTRPKQRKTGRIYLGPFNTTVMGTSADGVARSTEGWRNVVSNAAEELQEALNAIGCIWCVWSRADEQLYGITSVEVDNSFDVLRSRQALPGERVKVAFAPVPSLALGA